MIATSFSDNHQAQTTFRLIEVRGGLAAVPGIKLAGVYAAIKRPKRDLALIAFENPQVCASVITTNEIKAAPLVVSEEHLAAKGDRMRALVCNSGCANACTGEIGERDARETARQTAELLGIEPDEVIIASTGVIGVPMPMERLSKGLELAFDSLSEGGQVGYDAAEAIMTTDRIPKLAAYAFYDGETRYVVGGIAKGSGMIAPHLATMLGFIATNAPMSREVLQQHLRAACDASFNMISVDGDMSTNDAVYAFAPPGKDAAPQGFAQALNVLTRDLAIAIVHDGEGATKTLTLEVTGARDLTQARQVALSVVNSSLVKTAVHGEDPNWGRIIAAAGSAQTRIDPTTWSLFINGKLWVERGAGERLSEAQAHAELEGTRIVIRLDLGIGNAQATAWGCDLSSEYVNINAHYRT
ncbi:MAG TPA: bifunctional glutamate N-acetyltransferase/amino-acid acetyltransferase ArgJ [Candidatus Baltobacteraceae bacterium]|jgi:glutamate N-acetyltransferase/amino-acid N-acetyltransferase|nr:bifunctional glutamate N-acetyltransferase/amino-acid acetyltransferase ArgJ [Candidatus Baltobacteraceae bacterium]